MIIFFRLEHSMILPIFTSMKSKSKKSADSTKSLREQILKSMLASFKIEGINIPADLAISALDKVEINLGK